MLFAGIFDPSLPNIRFDGWLKREVPAIAGPEKHRDLDPEFPTMMPVKDYLPGKRKDLDSEEQTRNPLNLDVPDRMAPAERKEILTVIPDTHQPDWAELGHPSKPEIVLPLPADLVIRKGEPVKISFPEQDETVEYRIDYIV